MSRKVVNSFKGTPAMDGHGVSLYNIIGGSTMRQFDPFLLLDMGTVTSLENGFPEHPHRGFETVSYLLDGGFRHEDFLGKTGFMEKGDVQWMTAGRGIVHCEMPTRVPATAIQLWINLLSSYKMVEPSYQDLRDKDIPRLKKDGVWVKVIAGNSMGIESPVYTRTPAMFLHVKLDLGATFQQPVTSGWSAFVLVLSGSASFGPADSRHQSQPQYILIFGDGDCVEATNDSGSECEFLLVAGQPLNEPISRSGPFVMNTDEEIARAKSDYADCKNGFENAKNWKSNLMKGSR